MKKIISLILVLSLLLSIGMCMSACGEDKPVENSSTVDVNSDNNSSDDTSSEDNKIEEDDKTNDEINDQIGDQYNDVVKIKLFNNGKAIFRVVRSAEAGKEEIAVAEYACKALKETHGFDVAYKTDEAALDPQRLEVNIGLTNRPMSADYSTDISTANENNGMDYSIIKKDNVIYISALNAVALKTAVKAFLSYFCATTDGEIPENFSYKYHIDEGFAIAGNSNLSQYKIIVPKYNFSYYVARELGNLVDGIMASTGSDVAKNDDSYAVSDYEIIIGNADREGVKTIGNADEYIINLSGNKLFVNGGSDFATAAAVKTLINWVNTGVRIPAELEYSGSYALDMESATAADYKLAWYDEFDNIDSDVWNISNGLYETETNDVIGPRSKFFSNKEDNIKTEDSKLVMKATYDDDYYYGAQIKNKYVTLKYGIIEVSAKMDFSKGIVPVLSLVGRTSNDIYGQFNCFEGIADADKLLNAVKATSISYVNDRSNELFGETEIWYDGSVEDHITETLYNLSEENAWSDYYHTIGVEWTPTTVKWFVDGNVYLEIDTTKDERSFYTFNGQMNLMLSLYAGKDFYEFGLPSSETDWDNNLFTVDYVKVYQNGDGKIDYNYIL